MATIGEYINDEVSQLRLPLSVSQLNAIFIKNGVASTDEQTPENLLKMDIAIVSIIPKLLAMPDKTTGDTSLKWDRDGVLNYYRIKCAELGLPDLTAEEDTVVSFSNNLG